MPAAAVAKSCSDLSCVSSFDVLASTAMGTLWRNSVEPAGPLASSVPSLLAATIDSSVLLYFVAPPLVSVLDVLDVPVVPVPVVPVAPVPVVPVPVVPVPVVPVPVAPVPVVVPPSG